MLSRDRVPVTPIRNKIELMIPCLYLTDLCDLGGIITSSITYRTLTNNV